MIDVIIAMWIRMQKCYFLFLFERPLQQFCTTVQTENNCAYRTCMRTNVVVCASGETWTFSER